MRIPPYPARLEGLPHGLGERPHHSRRPSLSAASGTEIRVLQGVSGGVPPADINVVIDVIRAFTVAHVAFLRGAREILLVNTVEEAQALKRIRPDLLLAGEVKGLPIPGFDLDNSPSRFSRTELQGRTLVQKTTNGVRATLAALDARRVFVTGFSNAGTTADWVRRLLTTDDSMRVVNVIASHDHDDDDLACAEYIQDRVLGAGLVRTDTVMERIRRSRPAAKFLSPNPRDFDPRDLEFCACDTDSGFVMEVDRQGIVPTIRRLEVGKVS